MTTISFCMSTYMASHIIPHIMAIYLSLALSSCSHKHCYPHNNHSLVCPLCPSLLPLLQTQTISHCPQRNSPTVVPEEVVDGRRYSMKDVAPRSTSSDPNITDDRILIPPLDLHTTSHHDRHLTLHGSALVRSWSAPQSCPLTFTHSQLVTHHTITQIHHTITR